jgi:hypothetical protein
MAFFKLDSPREKNRIELQKEATANERKPAPKPRLFPFSEMALMVVPAKKPAKE